MKGNEKIKYSIGVDLAKDGSADSLVIMKIEEDVKTVFLSLTGEEANLMYDCLKEIVSFKGTVVMGIE